jgi:hypothetical protein
LTLEHLVTGDPRLPVVGAGLQIGEIGAGLGRRGHGERAGVGLLDARAGGAELEELEIAIRDQALFAEVEIGALAGEALDGGVGAQALSLAADLRSGAREVGLALGDPALDPRERLFRAKLEVSQLFACLDPRPVGGDLQELDRVAGAAPALHPEHVGRRVERCGAVGDDLPVEASRGEGRRGLAVDRRTGGRGAAPRESDNHGDGEAR